MKVYRWVIVGLLGVWGVWVFGALSFAVEGMSPVRAQAILQKYSWLLDSPVRAYLSGATQSFFHALEQIAQGKKLTPLDVRVNNPSTDDLTLPAFTQNEPTVAFSPSTGTICAAWNDSAQFLDEGSVVGYGRSTDGGASFTDLFFMPPPVEDFLNLGAPNATLTLGDPVNAFRAASDEFLYSSLAFDLDLDISLIGVYHSSDDCETWDTTDVTAGGTFRTVLPGLDVFNGVQDKPWMTVDNTGGDFDGHIYVCWTEFFSTGFVTGTRILFRRSINGGETWPPAIQLSPGDDTVQGCNIAIGPNGEVYVAWERYVDSSTAEIRISRSDDGGATFALNNVLVASLNQLGDARATCFGLRVLGGDIRINEFPSLAVNQLNGHVYVAYASRPTIRGRLTSDKADVFLARSTDQGASWSGVKVNDDRTTRDQFFPVVRWANPDPDEFPDGIVKVAFYDRRLDSANYRIDLFAAESINSGVSFLSNTRVSDVSFLPYRTNPNIDAIFRDCYMGDYNDMVAADQDGDDLHDSFYIVWGDNREMVRLPTRRRTPDPNVYFDEQPLIASCLLDFDPDPAGDDPDLDFGDVLVRGTSQLAIHLTNIGGRDCRVTRVFSSNSVFRFVGAEGFGPTTRLPQSIPPGQSLALIIEARPTRADVTVTGNITVMTNDPTLAGGKAVFGAQVFGVSSLSPLGLRALQLKPLGGAWALHGEGITGLKLEIFDLRGRKLLEQEAAGASLVFHALDPKGQPLANGVYLYVVTVRGDGKVMRREARKLVLLR